MNYLEVFAPVSTVVVAAVVVVVVDVAVVVAAVVVVVDVAVVVAVVVVVAAVVVDGAAVVVCWTDQSQRYPQSFPDLHLEASALPLLFDPPHQSTWPTFTTINNIREILYYEILIHVAIYQSSR